MEMCEQCHAAARKPLGSGPYATARFCVSCYFDWYTAKTKAEDFHTLGNYGAQVAARTSPEAPRQAKAGEPGATPVWHPGRNVVVAEKVCRDCGVIIHIRKNAKGRHYPSDLAGAKPHECRPAERAG